MEQFAQSGLLRKYVREKKPYVLFLHLSSGEKKGMGSLGASVPGVLATVAATQLYLLVLSTRITCSPLSPLGGNGKFP